MTAKRQEYNENMDALHEPLDRERIVRAALELLNEVGLQQLTMRRLAEALNIKAASLYWHVRDKTELLQLLADNICQRVVLPDQSLPWRELVLSIAGQYRGVLLSIQDSAEVMADTSPSTPNRLRLIEAIVQIFTRAGFSPEEVFGAGGLLNNYILMFVMDEMRFVRMAKDQGRSMEEDSNEFRSMLKNLPPEEYPTFVRLAEYAADTDMDKQFQFGLQVLLDGLAARLPGSCS